jgi:hypothetical protein
MSALGALGTARRPAVAERPIAPPGARDSAGQPSPARASRRPERGGHGPAAVPSQGHCQPRQELMSAGENVRTEADPELEIGYRQTKEARTSR